MPEPTDRNLQQKFSSVQLVLYVLLQKFNSNHYSSFLRQFPPLKSKKTIVAALQLTKKNSFCRNYTRKYGNWKNLASIGIWYLLMSDILFLQDILVRTKPLRCHSLGQKHFLLAGIFWNFLIIFQRKLLRGIVNQRSISFETRFSCSHLNHKLK